MSEIRKYGLIGRTLKHSFSKLYFEENITLKHPQFKYHLYELNQIEELETLLKDPTLFGLNITTPYKTSALAYADEFSPEVIKIGAANTFARLSTGQWKAFNTDVFGFSESVKPFLTNSKKVLILGTGGAAKAVGYSLRQLDVSHLFVSQNPKGKNQISYQKLTAKIMTEFQLIINATPLGTFPNINGLPPIPYQYLTSSHFLFDLVYNPNETAFLKKGKDAGCQLKNGLEMLHLQAQKAWDIWNLPF